ncbi:MAG: porin [Saprospiraceae bacterium]|nr:porin [Saprospiraceae bacterium]
MKNILLLIFLTGPLVLSAQTDTSALNFSFSGYAEPYYGYDFGQPADANRPGFVYSHNRHNEFNINIAYLKASVSAARVRGNLALMAGTYANANLAAEPGTLRNVFEANAGVKLSKKSDLWLDAGIFASHIGFESAIGKDCWTLTRSMVADNSPYYESGAKLTYTTSDGRWLFSALALNGWQRIQRAPGNSMLSGGWQIQYKPSSRILLNSSSFFGTDKPDDERRTRVYHNLYGIFQLSDRVGLILGLDTGWEEPVFKGADTRFWYTPVLIGKFTLSDRLAIGVRGEYFSDETGVIIGTATENGFQTFGASANLDVQIHRNALWRIEGKWWNSRDRVFLDADGNPSLSNAVLTTALAIWF